MQQPLELGLSSADELRSLEERPYCLQKAHCCCCLTPRWAVCPICVAVCYVLLIPILYVVAHYLAYPGDDYVPNQLNLDYLDYSCRLINFTGRYGDVLAEKCLPKDVSEGVPVLAFGGNGMNMFSTTASVVSFLPRKVNWEVYSMSFPGAQYAPRKGWTTEGWTEADALDLLHHLYRLKGQPIVIFGWSLGTSVAAGVASKQPDEVRCILLGNPFTSLRDVASSWTYGFSTPFFYVLDEWLGLHS